MKVEEVQKLLEAYGLSETEVRAFYHLGKLGEATATEVAKESGISRAEVYRAADGLERRGLIQRTMDRPQRFVPRPIDHAVATLLKDERSRLQELESTREDLVVHWPKPSGSEGMDEERFQVHRGRAQIEGMLNRMLERSEREIAFAAPHRTINRLLTWGIGDALAGAVQRGVRLRLLTQITEDLMGADSGLPEGSDIRHSEVPTYAQFMIVDQKEIAVYVTVDPVVGSTGRPETVLWLNSPDFIMGQQTLFDDLWMSSVTLEQRREELETGTRGNYVDVVRGRMPRLDEMRSLIARGTTRLRVAVPAVGQEFERLRLDNALKRAAGKDVQVQVLMPEVPEALARLDAVECRRGAIHPRLGVLLVDDREALVVLLPEDPEDGRSERSIEVTVPLALQLLGERFDAAWGAAE